MNSLITTAFSGIGSFEPVLDMLDVSLTFDDADDEFGNDIYKLLHNVLNKYVSKIVMVIYIVTLVCGALGLHSYLFISSVKLMFSEYSM